MSMRQFTGVFCCTWKNQSVAVSLAGWIHTPVPASAVTAHRSTVSIYPKLQCLWIGSNSAPWALARGLAHCLQGESLSSAHPLRL